MNTTDPIDAIRSKCACRHDDARACYELRYPQPIGFAGDDDRHELDDERCECACHRELKELDGPEPWEERP